MIAYSLEIIATLFFIVAILANRIRLKYKIKEELLIISICLVLTRLAALSSLTHFNCFFILNHLLYQPEYYITLAVLLIMFTFLVPVPLWVNRNASEGPNI